MGLAMFCLSLRSELKHARAGLEGRDVEALAYTNDTTLGLMGVTARGATSER